VRLRVESSEVAVSRERACGEMEREREGKEGEKVNGSGSRSRSELSKHSPIFHLTHLLTYLLPAYCMYVADTRLVIVSGGGWNRVKYKKKR
jgi:hypothetical protein